MKSAGNTLELLQLVAHTGNTRIDTDDNTDDSDSDVSDENTRTDQMTPSAPVSQPRWNGHKSVQASNEEEQRVDSLREFSVLNTVITDLRFNQHG